MKPCFRGVDSGHIAERPRAKRGNRGSSASPQCLLDIFFGCVVEVSRSASVDDRPRDFGGVAAARRDLRVQVCAADHDRWDVQFRCFRELLSQPSQLVGFDFAGLVERDHTNRAGRAGRIQRVIARARFAGGNGEGIARESLLEFALVAGSSIAGRRRSVRRQRPRQELRVACELARVGHRDLAVADPCRDPRTGVEERAQAADLSRLFDCRREPGVGAETGIGAIGARRQAARAAGDREGGVARVGLHGRRADAGRRYAVGGIARHVGRVERAGPRRIDRAADRPSLSPGGVDQDGRARVRLVGKVVEFVFARGSSALLRSCSSSLHPPAVCRTRYPLASG